MQGKYSAKRMKKFWKGILLVVSLFAIFLSTKSVGTQALKFHQTPAVENRFAATPYTWKIQYNIGDVSDTTIVTYQPSVDVTVTGTAPVKTGYNFMGWADTAEAEAAKYASGQALEITPDSANVTAVAGAYNTYTVDFHPVFVVKEVTLVSGETLNATINVGTLATNEAPNTVVESVIFCDYEDLAAKGVTAAWKDGADVDADGQGNARLFRSSDGKNVYICVKAGTEKLYMNQSSASAFRFLRNVGSIDFGTKISTKKVTSMNNMFHGCSSLTSLDLRGWDTANVTKMEHMFAQADLLSSISGIEDWNVSSVKSMMYMFSNTALETLNLKKWNTSSVTNMERMFCLCKYMTSLDVSNFETENVTNMAGMFTGCNSLQTLDVSNFDTAKVEYFNYMFSGCKQLEELDVSGFKTGNAQDMSYMFAQCKLVEELDVSGFETGNVTNMQSLFSNCERVKELDVSNFDTSKVTNMDDMFMWCKEVTYLDVSNFDTSSVTSTSSMFSNCTALQTLDVSSFETGNVTDMTMMFYFCENLTTIYADEDWDVSKVTTSGTNTKTDKDYNMFAGCTVLVGGEGTTYDPNNIDKDYAKLDKVHTKAIPGYFTDVNLQNVTLVDGMTLGMKIRAQSSIDRQGNVTDVVFCDYEDLADYGVTSTWVGDEDSNYEEKELTWENGIDVDASGLGNARLFRKNNKDNTQKVYICVKSSTRKLYMNESAAATFYGLSSMTKCDFNNTDWGKLSTEKVTDLMYMFCGCYDVPALDLSFFDTSNVSSMQGMFDDCESLIALDLSNFDTGKVTNMMGMFEDCGKLVNLNISSFDTSNVTNMQNMFGDCESLVELDLSSFETSRVTNMATMFRYSDNMETIIVSDGWNTENVTKSDEMFTDNTALKGQNGTTYSYEHRDKSYARVDTAETPGYLTLSTTVTGISKTATLLAGTELNTAIRAAAGDTAVTGVVFCDYEDLASYGVGAAWESGTDVSATANGEIRLFAGNGTVYVCTQQKKHTVYLNENSAGAFRDLPALTSVVWGKVSSRKTTDMSNMFSGCTALTELDLSGFDTANVSNMSNMFDGCGKLVTIYAGKAWTVAGVTSSGGMFNDCVNLKSWKGTAYDANVAADKTYAVIDQLETGVAGYLSPKNIVIDAPGTVTLLPGRELNPIIKGSEDEYDTDFGVKSVMFCHYSQAEDLLNAMGMNWESGIPVDNNQKGTVRLFDVAAMQTVCICVNSDDITTIYLNEDSTQTFNLLRAMTSVDFGDLVSTAKVTTMEKMFFGNSALQTISGTAQWQTGNVTNTMDMFTECQSLETIAMLAQFDTSNVQTMQNMFNNCSALQTLNLSSFNTANVTNMGAMFQNCTALTTIYVGGGWTTEATTVACDNMFTGCTALVGGAGTTYSDGNPNNRVYAHIDAGATNPGYLTDIAASVMVMSMEPEVLAAAPAAPEEITTVEPLPDMDGAPAADETAEPAEPEATEPEATEPEATKPEESEPEESEAEETGPVQPESEEEDT